MKNRWNIGLVALAIACTVIAQKPTPSTGTITYLRTEADVQYIYDAGSFVSNDLVHVAFTYAVAPGTADFQLWAWPNASTNEEEMVLVYSNTLAGVTQPYEFEYAGAISNRWFGFTTWTPGPSVHTNGVALVNWQIPYDPAATNIAAMTRTGVYFNGVRLAPNVIARPYDAEVEYLESTGTQWIDTGIVPTTDTSCNLVFSVTALDSTYRTPLSVRSWDGAADSFTISSGTTSGNTFAFGSNYWTGASIPSVGEVYLATLKSGLATLGDATGNAGLLITPSGLTAYLFARNSNGTASNFLKGRIYSCKIWQSGTLVRDFIPVRKGNVGYMYDRVSGRLFGNAGTGAFIIGPDK